MAGFHKNTTKKNKSQKNIKGMKYLINLLIYLIIMLSYIIVGTQDNAYIFIWAAWTTGYWKEGFNINKTNLQK